MPYKEYPNFTNPSDPNSKIWRYMDITKFLSILDTRSLYFTRVDQLGNFDLFEGYYTNLNFQLDNIPFEKRSDEWKAKTGIKTKNLRVNY